MVKLTQSEILIPIKIILRFFFVSSYKRYKRHFFSGVCYKVGCDWIVDSDAEEDACGVCGGDGSACKTVQGIYSKGTTRQSGFSEVYNN